MRTQRRRVNMVACHESGMASLRRERRVSFEDQPSSESRDGRLKPIRGSVRRGRFAHMDQPLGPAFGLRGHCHVPRLV
jgi:hypothetical protein